MIYSAEKRAFRTSAGTNVPGHKLQPNSSPRIAAVFPTVRLTSIQRLC